MTLIFCLSAQPAGISSQTSGSTIEFIVSIIVPDFEDMSFTKQVKIIEAWQFYIRKLAHLSLYFVLGGLAYLCFVPYRSVLLPIRALLGFIISLLYAVGDEYHQTLVEGRSGELRDIGIDCAGALLAVLLALLINYCIRRHKGKIKMKKKDLIQQNRLLAENCKAFELELKKIKLENEFLCNQLSDVQSQNRLLTVELEAIKQEHEKTTQPTEQIAEEPPAEKVLEAENDAVEEAVVIDKEQKTEAAAESTPIELSSDTAFGAEIIGKIVLSAAKHCNTISSDNSFINAKELINLILGRTEVAKAEILNIVSSQADIEIKKSMMHSEQNACEDYFLSVLAQKG